MHNDGHNKLKANGQTDRKVHIVVADIARIKINSYFAIKLNFDYSNLYLNLSPLVAHICHGLKQKQTNTFLLIFVVLS